MIGIRKSKKLKINHKVKKFNPRNFVLKRVSHFYNILYTYTFRNW